MSTSIGTLFCLNLLHFLHKNLLIKLGYASGKTNPPEITEITK